MAERYRNSYRDELDLDDEDEFMDGEQQENDEDIPLDDPEEDTFRKRYGDLRRHLHEKERNYEARLNALQGQLNSSVAQEMKLPKTAEEVGTWKNKFPDVYDIIRTIAISEVKQERQNIDKELSRVSKLEQQINAKDALIELKRIHPDFDVIRQDKAFHGWAKEQSQWVIDALYHNDTDYQAAADAIDLYKARTRKKPTAENPRGAAEAVRRGESLAPSGNGGKRTFKESEVQAMSDADYDRLEAEIDRAIAEGRYIYDMTPGAR